MSKSERYVMRVLGHEGRLIGHRYAFSYQAIDKMAAVRIPMAEMLRLFGETGGNTAAVLSPMQAALGAKGYDTLMVLPAQAQVVELVRQGGDADAKSWDELHAEAAELQRRSAILLKQAAETLLGMQEYLSKQQGAQAAELRAQAVALAQAVAAEYGSMG